MIRQSALALPRLSNPVSIPGPAVSEKFIIHHILHRNFSPVCKAQTVFHADEVQSAATAILNLAVLNKKTLSNQFHHHPPKKTRPNLEEPQFWEKAQYFYNDCYNQGICKGCHEFSFSNDIYGKLYHASLQSSVTFT